MRDILRKNLISPKPRKRPLAVVKTELPAWREMRPSQSFEQKFRAPPARPQVRLKYDKVPETSLLFSLFCTVFAIWKHLEAFGY